MPFIFIRKVVRLVTFVLNKTFDLVIFLLNKKFVDDMCVLFVKLKPIVASSIKLKKKKTARGLFILNSIVVRKKRDVFETFKSFKFRKVWNFIKRYSIFIFKTSASAIFWLLRFSKNNYRWVILVTLILIFNFYLFNFVSVSKSNKIAFALLYIYKSIIGVFVFIVRIVLKVLLTFFYNFWNTFFKLLVWTGFAIIDSAIVVWFANVALDTISLFSCFADIFFFAVNIELSHIFNATLYWSSKFNTVDSALALLNSACVLFCHIVSDASLSKFFWLLRFLFIKLFFILYSFCYLIILLSNVLLMLIIWTAVKAYFWTSFSFLMTVMPCLILWLSYRVHVLVFIFVFLVTLLSLFLFW